MMRKKAQIVLLVTALLLVVAAFVRVPVGPPADTRMVLDHTHKIYIAPACFEQSASTNYLTEATLGEALGTGYEPESACTTVALEPRPLSLWNIVLQTIGLRKDERYA
ncbi:hypothetical protein IDH44_21285 [Paenibacillus sp. IB182496]|uniref:Uncharacterized protein n=1 Tax=Paenibacillus sabuli TaxID=2772509 RepID=A0A927BYG5_9BACL|nr:hypothetical protein [Paenibacillus sabuli]MBD2847734.1 hypothetical protein [Paenibacillus sabuli]